MKKLLLLLTLAFTINVNAQDDKTVTLVVSGQGKTKDEAQQKALRSAIEQAFGTFISSKTEILNDNLVKDEIISVTNGNIQKFEPVSEVQLPDGSYASTLKATVSVSKLTSFCESKGVEVEFKGGIFAINIKQQLLNEVAETKAVWNMLFLMSPIAFQSVDYTVDAKDPQSIEGSSEKWAIPIMVTAKANKNMDFVFNFMKKQLPLIALTNEEADNYQKINKKTYAVIIDEVAYYFRKMESKRAIDFFLCDLFTVFENYIVSNGLDSLNGHSIKKERNSLSLQYKDYKSFRNNYTYTFKSINAGNEVSKFSFNDLKTLNQINAIAGYKVIPAYPKSNIGVWKSGGVVFAEFENGGEMIMSLFNYSLDDSIVKKPQCSMESLTKKDLWRGKSNTEAIVKNCNNYTPAHYCQLNSFNGYSDWFLPSYDELLLIKHNLYDLKIGVYSYFNYNDNPYNSCSLCSSWGHDWYRFDFHYLETSNGINDFGENGWNLVRPVRIQK
jgi:hypothetical protein